MKVLTVKSQIDPLTPGGVRWCIIGRDWLRRLASNYESPSVPASLHSFCDMIIISWYKHLYCHIIDGIQVQGVTPARCVPIPVVSTPVCACLSFFLDPTIDFF